MKTCIKKLFSCPCAASRAVWVLSALVAALGLALPDRVTAQTFTVLHNFTGRTDGSDGYHPRGSLVLSGDTLYGTTTEGGFANGAVFRVNTDGTGFTILHNFTYPVGDNDDGAGPVAGLILSGNTLYGTAADGGISRHGTVFAVNTDGTGFTTLHRFTGDTNDFGYYPCAGLVLSSNSLYGTTRVSNHGGTVFAVHTDGTGFTTLYNFTYGDDGAGPQAALVLSGNTFYGTAASAGSSYAGTVFAVNTDGTGFTILHSFTGGSDGGRPLGALVLSGNTLYGTVSEYGAGAVFAVNTDGTGFTNVHSFAGGSEGAGPVAGLVLSGSTLYGTAQYSGSSENGTVFAVNTDGTGFKVLHTFTATACDNCPNSDGAFPSAALILSGNTLYGTTTRGGSSGYGTAFSLSLPPQLKIITSGANAVLTWPTNTAGLTLQSTTNLVSPAVWTTVSPGPVVVNGQNTITNAASGPRKFYRLGQ